MSMHPPLHPDPELLAALAGDDDAALAEPGLADHVAGCAVCGRQVAEMRAIRSALAELPDLAPSRPLLLVPPIIEPAPSGGRRAALRRAFAPLAVAGLALMVVGGVGATGALGPADAVPVLENLVFPAADSAAAPEAPTEMSRGDVETPASTPSPAAPDVSALGGEAASTAPRPTEEGEFAAPGDEGERAAEVPADLTARSGWVWLGLAGAGLLALAFVLRRAAVRA